MPGASGNLNLVTDEDFDSVFAEEPAAAEAPVADQGLVTDQDFDDLFGPSGLDASGDMGAPEPGPPMGDVSMEEALAAPPIEETFVDPNVGPRTAQMGAAEMRAQRRTEGRDTQIRPRDLGSATTPIVSTPASEAAPTAAATAVDPNDWQAVANMPRNNEFDVSVGSGSGGGGETRLSDMRVITSDPPRRRARRAPSSITVQRSRALREAPVAGAEVDQELSAMKRIQHRIATAGAQTAEERALLGIDLANETFEVRHAMEDAADRHFAEREARLAAMEELNRAVASRQIDPNNFFASRGGGAAIGSSIAVALGTFGQALSGTPNHALSIINGAIERDIQAQIENRAAAERGVQRGLTLYDRFVALTGDEQQARLMTLDLMQAEVQTRIEAAIQAGLPEQLLGQAQLAVNQIQLQRRLGQETQERNDNVIATREVMTAALNGRQAREVQQDIVNTLMGRRPAAPGAPAAEGAPPADDEETEATPDSSGTGRWVRPRGARPRGGRGSRGARGARRRGRAAPRDTDPPEPAGANVGSIPPELAERVRRGARVIEPGQLGSPADVNGGRQPVTDNAGRVIGHTVWIPRIGVDAEGNPVYRPAYMGRHESEAQVSSGSDNTGGEVTVTYFGAPPNISGGARLGTIVNSEGTHQLSFIERRRGVLATRPGRGQAIDEGMLDEIEAGERALPFGGGRFSLDRNNTGMFRSHVARHPQGMTGAVADLQALNRFADITARLATFDDRTSFLEWLTAGRNRQAVAGLNITLQRIGESGLAPVSNIDFENIDSQTMPGFIETILGDPLNTWKSRITAIAAEAHQARMRAMGQLGIVLNTRVSR